MMGFEKTKPRDANSQETVAQKTARALQWMEGLGLGAASGGSLWLHSDYPSLHGMNAAHRPVMIAPTAPAADMLRFKVQRALDGLIAGTEVLCSLEIGGISVQRNELDLPILSLLPDAQLTANETPEVLSLAEAVLIESGAANVWEALYAQRPGVQACLQCFAEVAEAERMKRAPAYAAVLQEEWLDMAATVQDLSPIGWSAAQEYDRLPFVQKLWLDPHRAHLPEEGEFRSEWLWMGWPDAVGEQLVQWLQGQGSAAAVLAQHASTLTWRDVLVGQPNGADWAQAMGAQFRDRTPDTQPCF